MTTHKADVIQTKSIAEVVLNSDIWRIRKWLLRKLMPEYLWEMPPISLAKLQAGAVIGSMTMHINDICGDTDLDIGEWNNTNTAAKE